MHRPPLYLLPNVEDIRMKEGPVKRGEMYYADLEPVRGSEQGGIRPVLVIQNDIGNAFSPTTIVAAITGSLDKADLPTHIFVCADCLKKPSIILLEQIRTIDRCRLFHYIGRLDDTQMLQVNQVIQVSFGLTYSEGDIR